LAQDSSRPEFWDVRFRAGATPWDAGGVPPRLAAWVEAKRLPLRILVPGCGAGYEVKLFAECGHDVLGIDFSDAALDAARRHLGAHAGRARKADVFRLDESPFDLVYERAFLCALPRARWPEWGTAMARLVRPGGELAAFFYLDNNERGPPFGISRAGIGVLLESAFALAEDAPVSAAESLSVFRGKEIWQVWRRRL
jgi:SAM-dependent methyltransferase